MKNADDEWVFDEAEPRGIAVNYFGDLYTAYYESMVVTTRNSFPPVDLGVMEKGIWDVTMDDEKHALFEMSLHKAPGVDDYPMTFFQKNWNVIKSNFLSFV